MDMNHLNFEQMKNNSHKNKYFNRYINIICELFDVDFINAFELYNVKTPFDININGKINIEVKIQNRFALEVYTDDDKKKMGWVFTLMDDEVDYVLFFFPDENKYFCLKASELHTWWLEHFIDFETIRNKTSIKGNRTWVSSFSYVGRGLIPTNIVYKTNIEFVDKDGFNNLADWI